MTCNQVKKEIKKNRELLDKVISKLTDKTESILRVLHRHETEIKDLKKNQSQK